VKDKPSPVAFPTTDEDAKLWGFDILEPVGTPMAWVHDWKEVMPGFSKPMQSGLDVAAVLSGMEGDLSKLRVDDVLAALCFLYRGDIFEMIEGFEEAVGKETVMQVLRERGIKGGSRGWMSSQGMYGQPLPLDKIALYQDTVHMLFGPNMQPNTWFDDEKVVCSRTDCTFSPPADIREKAAFCRTLCGGMTDAYMQCEPDLLTARLVDIGEEGTTTRCVHLWTYKPEVFDKLHESCRANIPETTRKVLAERGVKSLD
jgi:hypothetical protein